MKHISVHAFRHDIAIHIEDTGAMKREHFRLTYREAQEMKEKLEQLLSHPSHKGLLAVPSKKSTPVVIEDGDDGKPSLRIIK